MRSVHKSFGMPKPADLKEGLNTWQNPYSAGAIILSKTIDIANEMINFYMRDFPYSHYMTTVKKHELMNDMIMIHIQRRTSCD